MDEMNDFLVDGVFSYTFKSCINKDIIWSMILTQRIGGSWDGYWLTESLLHDGNGFNGGIAY